MEGNVCAQCGKDLTTVEEIHVAEGKHFCCKEHAIDYNTIDIMTNARYLATEWYNDCAEIVTPKDIGLVHEKKWTSYNAENDVTTIFLSKYLDKECTETISTEVVGFYWGEPNEEDTETYTGELKATY